MAKICFLGDVFLQNEGTLKCWPDILHADQCVFNFEYVYNDTTLNNVDAFPNKINLQGNGSPFLPGFKSYIANLANNHVMDFKEKGLASTLAFCKAHRCQVVGINNFQGYEIPRVIHLQDDITMSSYLQEHMFPKALKETEIVINKLELNKILEDAKRAHEKGSRFHVVYLHWGTELFPKPWPNQVELAHKLVDSGYVQLIIGMHSHCVQSMEIYKGRQIFYGLGNTVFPNYKRIPSFFKNSMPTKYFSESWGDSSKSSLAIILNTENCQVDYVKMRYHESLGELLNDNFKIPSLEIKKSDCWTAVFRRWGIAFRLLLRCQFKLFYWHLNIGIKSIKSYLKNYKKLRKEGRI